MYFFAIILWPFKEGKRFILPILPFICFYTFVGGYYILRYFFKKQYPFYIIFSFLIILNLAQCPFKNYTLKDLPLPLRNFILLHQWIKNNLPKDKVIISRKPTVTYLLTGNKAICYRFSPYPKQIWQQIIKNKVKYIIVDAFSAETYQYLLPFLYTYKDKLLLLHKVKNTGIFEIKNKL